MCVCACVYTWVCIYSYAWLYVQLQYTSRGPSVYMCERGSGMATMAILSLLPVACWHEPRQSGTNNTWRAVQRQLGSVVRAGPINEGECGRGWGRGAGAGVHGRLRADALWQIQSFPCPRPVQADTSLHPRGVAAEDNVANKKLWLLKMTTAMAGQPTRGHSGVLGGVKGLGWKRMGVGGI